MSGRPRLVVRSADALRDPLIPGFRFAYFCRVAEERPHPEPAEDGVSLFYPWGYQV